MDLCSSSQVKKYVHRKVESFDCQIKECKKMYEEEFTTHK